MHMYLSKYMLYNVYKEKKNNILINYLSSVSITRISILLLHLPSLDPTWQAESVLRQKVLRSLNFQSTNSTNKNAASIYIAHKDTDSCEIASDSTK